MAGGPADLDKLHFALERLLGAPEGWRSLVRGLVDRWPEAQPTELIYTITLAAGEIEATFAPGSPSREAADQAWRLAALLGADLFAMEIAGLPRSRADDFWRYWRIDPWFRDL